MSIAVMSQVWSHSRSQGASLLVLLALADHSDDAGVSYPGIPNLAKKCRVSERTAQRAIRDIVTMNELTVHPNKGIKTESGYTNQYRINLKNLRWQPDTPNSKAVSPEAASGDTAGLKEVTTLSPKPSVEPSVKPLEAVAEVLTLAASSPAKRTRKTAACPPTPAPASWSPELVAAWDDWQEHLRALRRPLTPPAARPLAKELELLGNDRAIAAIRFSISCGWKTIHEPKNAITHSRGASLDNRFQKAF